MRHRRAFTLIELLVVIAVIAILISILLPALGKARAAAQAVTSANLQRQFSIGAFAYANESRQFFPGVNSSGKAAVAAFASGNMQDYFDKPVSSRPVQVFDWISPSIGDDMPEDREARFTQLLTTYADPAQKISATLWAEAPDGQSELRDYLENEWGGDLPVSISYLQPAYFQLYGSPSVVNISGGGPFGGGSISNIGPLGQDNAPGLEEIHSYGATRGTATIASGYVPRLDKLGAMSRKIYSGTGTRYTDENGLTTVNGGYAPGTYGDFTTSGATFDGSTAYGINSDSMGINIPISYRHNGRMVAVKWDGSSEQLLPEQSRDPALWFPRGSRFGSSLYPEVSDFYEEGDLIP